MFRFRSRPSTAAKAPPPGEVSDPFHFTLTRKLAFHQFKEAEAVPLSRAKKVAKSIFEKPLALLIFGALMVFIAVEAYYINLGSALDEKAAPPRQCTCTQVRYVNQYGNTDEEW